MDGVINEDRAETGLRLWRGTFTDNGSGHRTLGSSLAERHSLYSASGSSGITSDSTFPSTVQFHQGSVIQVVQSSWDDRRQ